MHIFYSVLISNGREVKSKKLFNVKDPWINRLSAIVLGQSLVLGHILMAARSIIAEGNLELNINLWLSVAFVTGNYQNVDYF